MVMTNVVCVDDGRRSRVVCHSVFSWLDRLREFVGWIVVISCHEICHEIILHRLGPCCQPYVLFVSVPRALTGSTRLQQSCLPDPHVVIG
jgi:hypothetical protein